METILEETITGDITIINGIIIIIFIIKVFIEIILIIEEGKILIGI